MLAGIPIVEQIHAPSGQFRAFPNTVENLITSASVVVASDSKENLEQLIRLYCNICVVGEVATPE